MILYAEIGERWLLFVLLSCWEMNTQVSTVTGYSPYEMVYHCEPPDLFNFNYIQDKQVLMWLQNNT